MAFFTQASPDWVVSATQYQASTYGITTANTNNSPALQALIDQIAATGQPGLILFDQVGDYRFSQTINLRCPNLALRGLGKEQTRLLRNASQNTDFFVSLLSERFWSMEELTIDGNKTGNPTSGNGVTVFAPDLTPANGVDAFIAFKNVDIQECAGDGINFSGAGTVGSQFYNVREATLQGMIIRACNGHGVNANILSDTTFNNVVTILNRRSGFNFTGCGNLRTHQIKGFFNGIDQGSVYPEISFVNCSRIMGTQVEAQEGYQHGILISGCQDIVMSSVISDANGRPLTGPRVVPGYVPGYGLNIINSTEVNLVGVSTTSLRTPSWQDVGLILDNSDNVYVSMTGSNHVTENYRILNSPTSYLLSVNGTMRSDAINEFRQFALLAPNTRTTLSQSDGGVAGEEALFDFNPAPLNNQQAQVRFFRNTVTNIAATLVLFRGDGSNTVNTVLSGRGNAYLCQNNGLLGIGVVPVTGGGKLQIRGAVQIGSGTPSSTTPGDGNVLVSGWLSAGNNTISVTGPGFTSVRNSLHTVQTINGASSTTLVAGEILGGWRAYVRENAATFATAPLTINADTGETINGGASVTVSTDSLVWVFKINATSWRLVTTGSGVLPPARITTATTVPPGNYEVSSTGGSFTITLAPGSGKWQFYNADLSTQTNAVTIVAAGSPTFTDALGVQSQSNYTLNVGGTETTINNTAGGSVYYVTVTGRPSAGGVRQPPQNITSGTATTINPNVTQVIIDPATVLASHVLTLPAIANGEVLYISLGGAIPFGQPVVTSFNVVAPAGSSLVFPWTAQGANSGDTFAFIQSGTTYRRLY